MRREPPHRQPFPPEFWKSHPIHHRAATVSRISQWSADIPHAGRYARTFEGSPSFMTPEDDGQTQIRRPRRSLSRRLPRVDPRRPQRLEAAAGVRSRWPFWSGLVISGGDGRRSPHPYGVVGRPARDLPTRSHRSPRSPPAPAPSGQAYLPVSRSPSRREGRGPSHAPATTS